MEKGQKRISIRTKLISIFIVMLCSIVLISNLLVFNRIFSYVEENSITAELNETQIYAEQLNTWLAQYEILLKENAKGLSSIDQTNTEEVQNLFQKQLEGNDNVLLYYVVYNDNSSVFSDGWEAGLDYDFASLNFYSKPLENMELTYVEPEYDYVSEKLVIIMGMPVYDTEDKFIGITGIYINLDDVISQIGELNKESDNENYLFLVDDLGNIITHPKKDYMQVEDIRVNMNELIDAQYDKLYESFLVNNEKTKKLEINNKVSYNFTSNVGNTGWNLIQVIDDDVVTGLKKSAMQEVMIIDLIIIVICSIIIALILNTMLKKFINISRELEKLSNGNIKGYVPFENYQNDEIGDIYSSMNNLNESLEYMLGNIGASKVELGETTETLSKNIVEFDEGFKSVIESSDIMKKSIEGLNSDINTANCEIDNLSKDIEAINSQINSTISHMRNTSDISEKGLSVVNNLDIIEEKTRNQISQINKIITSFKETTSAIEEITKNISQISEQTSLLSLNASIEAARAGEDGKGFMIVANEVKDLSIESQKCVEDIQALLMEVNSENQLFERIESEINMLSNERKNINDSTKMAYDEIYKYISEDVKKVREMKNEINSIESTKKFVEETFNKLQKVSTEVSTNINNILDTFEVQNESLNEIKEMNKCIEENKEKLDENINKFIF